MADPRAILRRALLCAVLAVTPAMGDSTGTALPAAADSAATAAPAAIVPPVLLAPAPVLTPTPGAQRYT